MEGGERSQSSASHQKALQEDPGALASGHDFRPSSGSIKQTYPLREKVVFRVRQRVLVPRPVSVEQEHSPVRVAPLKNMPSYNLPQNSVPSKLLFLSLGVGS